MSLLLLFAGGAPPVGPPVEPPAVSATGGYGFLMRAPYKRGRSRKVAEDEAARAQQEREQALARLAQLHALEAAAVAKADALQAELATRIERDATSRRQQRIARQRIEAARVNARRIKSELRALQAREDALIREIEELDVLYVAAVLLSH